jgi:regulator of replication initiation timing
MDIDIPPEPLNLDAQHTELQLRYTTLQQEYQSVSIQHETLVSKSDTQHEKIHHIEEKNAEMEGLLEKYTGEHQQLNDAYHRVMQEHKACQKVQEQLQDLAHRWKAPLEENRELNSTCTKLRQELKKALENQKPDKPLARVEEVQAPAAIEATTMSDMEYSDDESISDDLILYTWTAGSDDRNQYAIFLVYAVTGGCELQGYSFNISRSIEEAIPQITDSLRQAKAAFGSDQYHAMTVLGTHLINTEPAYLFGCLEVNRTIFIGLNSVLAAFIPALTAGASSSQPDHSVVTIQQAATQALKEGSTIQGKRKRAKATMDIMAKRRRVAGVEAAPSTPSTKAKKIKPLGILKSKKARGSERAAAATSTSTAAEEQTYGLNILSRDFLFSLE